MKQQSVLRGSVWLIGSALLAKVLGAVFRIPLTAMLGGEGMGYFSFAYGLFLPIFALSVTGINTAVSAVTAQKRASGDDASAQRCVRIARRMFGRGGAVCAGILFFAAGPLCNAMGDPHAALAVKMLAPSIFFCCINAVLRGEFEGCCNMTPTAVSQVAEGIARAGFGLMLCGGMLRFAPALRPYLPQAVSVSGAAAAAAIFGVTLSTAVGTLALLLFPRPMHSAKLLKSPAEERLLRQALLQILLPVAAASLVTNLTTLVDLAVGLRLLAGALARQNALSDAAAAAQANFAFGAFSGLAVTVFNLVPAVTNMLGKGVFPAFAASCTNHHTADMTHHAHRVMQRTAFLAVPAGLGIAALAEPILMLLFPTRQTEIALAAPPLVILGFAVIFAAMSYPLFSMMQAAGRAGDTVGIMLWGAAVKLAGDLLLIPRFQLSGIAVSTLLCYAVIYLLALRRFQLRVHLRLPILRICGGNLFAGILCAVTARVIYERLLPVFPQRLALICGICAGGAVYLPAAALIQKKARPAEYRACPCGKTTN